MKTKLLLVALVSLLLSSCTTIKNAETFEDLRACVVKKYGENSPEVIKLDQLEEKRVEAERHCRGEERYAMLNYCKEYNDILQEYSRFAGKIQASEWNAMLTRENAYNAQKYQGLRKKYVCQTCGNPCFPGDKEWYDEFEDLPGQCRYCRKKESQQWMRDYLSTH